jgi:hypothetical protein
MSIIAKLIVTEDDGIRRFLYPLTVEIPFAKNDIIELAVKDEEENLLPSESYRTRSGLTLHFAISLEPYERRKLIVFKSPLKAAIPDPILSEETEDGGTVHRQERLKTTILRNTNLSSLVYDSVEHLAGPVTFSLNAEQPENEPLRRRASGGELIFRTSARRVYPANERFSRTALKLTACKSWVELIHTIEDPLPGSIISLDIPLSPPTPEEIPTCDFGLGNGVYAKIDGDAAMLEADFYGKKPSCCWQVSRLSEGIQRIDYQGDAVTIKSLSKSLYFHWTLPTRSLAVAITELPYTSTHVQAILGRSGRIHISVALSKIPARRATIGAVLHFLNDIPPIAAATNPASVVCPPRVALKA